MRRFATIMAVVFFLSSSANAMPEDTKNFRFGPIALLAGGLALDLDFRINEQWTIGPSLGYIKLKDKDRTTDSGDPAEAEVQASALGVRANYYFDSAFVDGWFLGPSFSFAKLEVDVKNKSTLQSASAEVSGAAIGILAGYHWFWDSFNLNLGAGISSFTGPEKVTVNYSDGTKDEVKGPNGSAAFAAEFSLGWTF